MSNITWVFCTVMAILLWAATCLLYKAGIHKESEKYTCLKYSVSIGLVFFAISFVYLIIRDEPFTILESAVRY